MSKEASKIISKHHMVKKINSSQTQAITNNNSVFPKKEGFSKGGVFPRAPRIRGYKGNL